MTRLSSGKVSIDRQWHPVEEIVGSTLNRMYQQLIERPVETQVDGVLPLIHVDAVLIEQLLVNLIDNAAKYSSPDKPIVVAARSVDGGVELEVSDRGRGFVDGDEKRVFDLFYRGSDVRSDRRGTGIGLAICRAIAEVHGGRIEAHNRPGGGAVVKVFLPCNEMPPAMTEQISEAASP